MKLKKPPKDLVAALEQLETVMIKYNREWVLQGFDCGDIVVVVHRDDMTNHLGGQHPRSTLVKAMDKQPAYQIAIDWSQDVGILAMGAWG